ncbi:50S ribosomal protein L11 [Candidatus Curtissbacteria bacterium RIFCSPHIGHO2_12_41_11]|uniref:Large ribosomal subunit protein uL11 n=2 Tax=Candidatus Curtissiibacteriota TaxID=1752717 RepID=A0A1F5G8Z4_9BACT|nr:MAG: 50S ribosomal protein L11 [Candidatus Curtissbacteria bacterium RIFCSPHIGHO2_02_FULL_40_16b]OGD99392.1 MAG: 50S ribosomal protein L11 [Candidatus Curtissbacteria bacterium RIFCSPHIGHO2_12_41_11]OGE00229.1 MAG: 50S ribosomal protein L11 [Candidatus Curtissbacteria bacterium RIFCSPLOWO2_02_FULL_40_11]
MAKKIKAIVKLNVVGAQATAAPPVGPTLSQHGLQIMDFVKAFNEKTKDQQGTVLPVVITIYVDRTFSFIVKKPPVAILIKKALNLEKGAQTTGKETVAKLSRSQAKKIAEEKMEDLNTTDLDSAINIITGTAKSMGVEVTE